MNVSGINNYSYSAPRVAFKGNDGETEQGSEKKITKKQMAIAGGTAAGVTALALLSWAGHRGKVMNGKEGKFFKNITDGFKSFFSKESKEAFKAAKKAGAKAAEKTTEKATEAAAEGAKKGAEAAKEAAKKTAKDAAVVEHPVSKEQVRKAVQSNLQKKTEVPVPQADMTKEQYIEKGNAILQEVLDASPSEIHL